MENQNNAGGAGQGTPNQAGAGGTPGGEKNTVMAVLSYLGPLVFVPFFTAKEDPFVKFHIKQGMVVFSIEVIVWLLGMTFMWQLYMLMRLLNLATLVLSIIGIVNAVKGQEKELPLVGKFSKYFKF